MCWDDYWDELIEKNKLKNVVKDINEFDEQNGYCIKNICEKIYSDYSQYIEELEKTRKQLLKIVSQFSEVHLETSRVKNVESLLCKVIEKRYAHIKDENSPYSTITEENYKNIIGDLIGIRLILSCREKWTELHEKITNVFPYASESDAYNNITLMKHREDGANFLAEIPKVYYACGDDLSIYEGRRMETILKENGYRSVHYIVSYQGWYAEIQVRTIYDEAWSDCEHSHVYKHEKDRSYTALKELCNILGFLTSASDELAEQIYAIFQNEAIQEKSGKYVLCEDVDLNFNIIFDRINNASILLGNFEKQIVKGETNGKQIE